MTKRIAIFTAAAIATILFGTCSAQTSPAKPTTTKTPSGIEITMQIEGTGAKPRATDTVKVHYRGTLTDGTEFDSSFRRKEPATFPLSGVIPCWTEGVQSIKVGGRAKLVCPPNLAYGSRGAGGVVPPNATLIFEIDLLDIMK